MEIKRFFLSFNEDCWFGRKVIKIGFLFVLLIALLIIILNGLKIISFNEVIRNKYFLQIFVFLVIFGVYFFYAIFLDIIPNKIISIPRYILIIISIILLPIGLILFRDVNNIIGLCIFLLINYLIGYDKIYKKTNILENIIVSIIRFINFTLTFTLLVYIIFENGILNK
jgi:hypothetical protein